MAREHRLFGAAASVRVVWSVGGAPGELEAPDKSHTPFPVRDFAPDSREQPTSVLRRTPKYWNVGRAPVPDRADRELEAPDYRHTPLPVRRGRMAAWIDIASDLRS